MLGYAGEVCIWLYIWVVLSRGWVPDRWQGHRALKTAYDTFVRRRAKVYPWSTHQLPESPNTRKFRFHLPCSSDKQPCGRVSLDSREKVVTGGTKILSVIFRYSVFCSSIMNLSYF
jgi:hypothetical protein